LNDKRVKKSASFDNTSNFDEVLSVTNSISEEQSDCVEEQRLKKINSIYNQFSNEEPDTIIDRQILAAAHREIASPNSREKLHTPWWRRLLLPLYVTTVFAFTAIGANLYWPEVTPHVPPGTAPGPVSIDLIESEAHLSELKLKQQAKVRKKTEMPQEISVLKQPISPKTKQQEAEKLVVMKDGDIEKTAINIVKQLEFQQQETELLNINASQLARKEPVSSRLGVNKSYPNKEAWARDIITMFKNGEYAQVKEELVLFKSTFPDYPIDDQIEVFRR
jgi:hypothetical protein